MVQRCRAKTAHVDGGAGGSGKNVPPAVYTLIPLFLMFLTKHIKKLTENSCIRAHYSQDAEMQTINPALILHESARMRTKCGIMRKSARLSTETQAIATKAHECTNILQVFTARHSGRKRW